MRGAYLWGNHSPTMCPDVSRAEAMVGGRWVPAEEGAALKRGRIGNPAGASSADLVGDGRAAWRAWGRETLVPAVRDR